MRAGDMAAGTGGGTWRHPSHHRPWLTDLRTGGGRDSWMHLLHHASPRTLHAHIRMLSLSHRVTWRQARMRHALMNSIWLSHHHRCTTDSSAVAEAREEGVDNEGPVRIQRVSCGLSIYQRALDVEDEMTAGPLLASGRRPRLNRLADRACVGLGQGHANPRAWIGRDNAVACEAINHARQIFPGLGVQIVRSDKRCGCDAGRSVGREREVEGFGEGLNLGAGPG